MQININKLKPILLPLFIAVALVVLILIIILSILVNNSSNQNIKNNKSAVVSVAPADGDTLISGKRQKFYVNLNGDSNNFVFKLSYFNVANDNNLPIAVGINTNSSGNNQIVLTSLVDIKERSEYLLRINDKSTSKILFSGSYLTTDITPTPVKSNSQSLIPFLPHQASNYSLEYLKNQNIYIFHFFYDVNSADSINNQQVKAKNDALQFIRDKGIDPSKLVIEWRNS